MVMLVLNASTLVSSRDSSNGLLSQPKSAVSSGPSLFASTGLLPSYLLLLFQISHPLSP